MVEATPVGDARRDTSGLKHSWSHHGADDADEADAGDADASIIFIGHCDLVLRSCAWWFCSNDAGCGVILGSCAVVMLCLGVLGVLVLWFCDVSGRWAQHPSTCSLPNAIVGIHFPSYIII